MEPLVVEIIGKTFKALFGEEGVLGHAAGHSSDILGYRSASLNRSADECGWSDHISLTSKVKLEELDDPEVTKEPNDTDRSTSIDILVF